MNFMFQQGDRVTHRNGGNYRIKKTPDHKRLEASNEPFYEYEDIASGDVWLRCKSEMEDGRFESAK